MTVFVSLRINAYILQHTLSIFAMENNKTKLAENHTPQERKLSMHMDDINNIILNIRDVTSTEIRTLEEQKRALRLSADPNIKYAAGKSSSVISSEQLYKSIQERVKSSSDHGAGEHAKLVEDLDKLSKQIGQVPSIEIVEGGVRSLDLEISRIKAESDAAILSLQQKSDDLAKRLASVQELDELIKAITWKMFDTEHEFQNAMSKLILEKRSLLDNMELKGSKVYLPLAEVDRKMADLNNAHNAIMASLEAQRKEIRQESIRKVQDLNAVLETITSQFDDMINELETSKKLMDESFTQDVDLRMDMIRNLYLKDLELLLQFQKQGWQPEINMLQLESILEARGLQYTKPTGSLSSKTECVEFVDKLSSGSSCYAQDKPSTTDYGSPCTSTSIDSILSSNDCRYLQKVLGAPLTLALTEITMKQPRDPIHYLGHWLYKYRYNQEVDVAKKQEIRDLMEERERIEREAHRRMLNDEARTLLFNLIARAEEEAVLNELRRIQRDMLMAQEEGETVYGN